MRLACAAEGLYRHSWPGNRQLENRRRTVQLPPPVIELRLQDVALQPFALPAREGGILNRQHRKSRRLFVREALVEGHQLTHQHTTGPRVRNDMMNAEEQYVIVLARLQQRESDRKSTRLNSSHIPL